MSGNKTQKNRLSPDKERVTPASSGCFPVKSNESECLDDQEESKGWRNLAAFWILGMCNNYGYVVMLSVALDLISHYDPNRHALDDHHNAILTDPTKRDCNHMSTGVVLLADIIPSLLAKIVAPFFPLYIHFRMFLVIAMSGAGYVLVAASQTQSVAIAGVIATSFSSGLGETTLLSYMSFFKNKNVVSTWSSGTGGAGLFGSLSYAAFTSLGYSPSFTLYLLLIVPAIMSVTFWVLLDRPLLQNHVCAAQEAECSNINSSRSNSNHVTPTLNNDTFCEKLTSIPSFLKYMVPYGFVYLFEYFINHGLFELIYFENISIDLKEQYRWYQFFYQLGVFISRSSVNLIQINAIWLLTVLQGLNVILFTTESVYSLTPNIYIVIAAVGWEGLIAGAAYVNTFTKINNEVVPDKREFAMSITTLCGSLGITISGFIAMPVHNYICSLPRSFLYKTN